MIASVLFMAVILLFGADDPAKFVDLPSIAIVLGGTLAATFLSYPLREIRRMFPLVAQVFRQERLETQHYDRRGGGAFRACGCAATCRPWSARCPRSATRFCAPACRLIIDRTPEDEIIDLLQWRIAHLRSREMAEAAIFRGMASYAPAFGMVGTLLGLINLMDLVGAGDLSVIGSQLAVALMTTLYGVLLANLLFKPIAVKLERRTEQRLVVMNMVLEGISMMCAGRSPSLMRETLKAFVAQFDDEMFDGGAAPTQPAPLPRPSPAMSNVDSTFCAASKPSQHPAAAASRSRQGLPARRYSRWHLETTVPVEEEGWLLTYLDVITLMLVMMVVMLSVAGPPGDATRQRRRPPPRQPPDPLATTTGRHRANASIACRPLPVTTASTQSATPTPPARHAESDTPQAPAEEAWASLKLDQIGEDVAITPGQDSVRFRISNELLFGSGDANLIDGGHARARQAPAHPAGRSRSAPGGRRPHRQHPDPDRALPVQLGALHRPGRQRGALPDRTRCARRSGCRPRATPTRARSAAKTTRWTATSTGAWN